MNGYQFTLAGIACFMSFVAGVAYGMITCWAAEIKDAKDFKKFLEEDV